MTTLRSRLPLLIALCGLSLLGACAHDNSSDNLKHSGGTPVNPNADPGGQGVPGSRATGANPRQSAGRP